MLNCRERDRTGDSEEAHRAEKHWSRGQLALGGIWKSVRRLGALSAKCRHTLTSFNWRWRCFTVLINGQRTKNTKLLLFLKGDKGRQMEDGGGIPPHYLLLRISLYSPSPTAASPNAWWFDLNMELGISISNRAVDPRKRKRRGVCLQGIRRVFPPIFWLKMQWILFSKRSKVVSLWNMVSFLRGTHFKVWREEKGERGLELACSSLFLLTALLGSVHKSSHLDHSF